MKPLLSRRNIFFTYFSLFSLASISCFLSEFDISVAGSVLQRAAVLFSIFNFFLCELFILLLAGQLLIYRNGFARLFLYTLSSLFIVIYCLQIAAVVNGKEFVSRLAVENWDHIYLFFNQEHVLYACFALAACFVLIYLCEKGAVPNRSPKKILTSGSLLLVIAIGATLAGDAWIPDKVLKYRSKYLSGTNLDHASPILSLYSVLYLQDIRYSQPLLHTRFKKYELEEINKFGFHYDPTKEYPLIKESIYTEEPPFPQKPETNGVSPHVIVFFSEGLSARAVGAYNSTYSNLTPNIDDFAGSSMIVRRYYNHTAATYRGLLGQLCSLFPIYGGAGGWQSNFAEVAENSYLSLADLFKRQGYETIFLDSHHLEHPSMVDQMAANLGFDTVVTGDALADRYLNGEAPLGKMAYSDSQYFNFVIGYLKERASDQNNQRPFFMSLYNFGTHAFLENSRDGIRYGSGKNNTLNNFHNLDHAFGQFWSYIKSSPYFENTVIIFTADHCHYQAKSFVQAFDDPEYQEIFVDRVPLIIRDPFRSLPAEYDADNSSSIDFAPTIAHYLGLYNGRSPFMGTSIFENHRKRYHNLSLASPGPGEIFLIDDKNIHKQDGDSKHRDRLDILNDYINLVRQLEMENKIWDDNFAR